jgi:hypothetical protein
MKIGAKGLSERIAERIAEEMTRKASYPEMVKFYYEYHRNYYTENPWDHAFALRLLGLDAVDLGIFETPEDIIFTDPNNVGV